MLTLSDYETVLALLEDRHFNRAARRLNITQPALTARLQRIEEVTGTRLFDRGRTGVTPTPAGIAFADGARRVIEAAHQTLQNTRSAALGLGETLTVGMTQIAAYDIVHRTLSAFRQLQPQARIRLTEGTTAALEARLESREIDLAFLHPPLHASSLAERLLVRGKLVKIDAANGNEQAPLVRYPRADAPVLMGRLAREGDAAGEVTRGEADTMLGAFVLFRAGYGTCVVEKHYLEAALISTRKGLKVQAHGNLDTSIAWRADDRREIVDVFKESAHAAVDSQEL